MHTSRLFLSGRHGGLPLRLDGDNAGAQLPSFGGAGEVLERHHELIQLVGRALTFKHPGEEAFAGIGRGLLGAMEDV